MISETIKVFVPDAECVWLRAEIIRRVSESHVEFNVENPENNNSTEQPVIYLNKVVLKCENTDSLPLQNSHSSPSGADDMCDLNHLHEAAILENLRQRFLFQQPYTNVGNICIAVNSFSITKIPFLNLSLNFLQINPYCKLNIYSEEIK